MVGEVPGVNLCITCHCAGITWECLLHLLSAETGSDIIEEVKDREEQERDDEEDEDSPPKPKKSKKSKKLPVGSVVAGEVDKRDHISREQEEREALEERRLAKMLLSKKKRRLYEQIVYSKKKKASLVRKLKQKRELYDRSRRILATK